MNNSVELKDLTLPIPLILSNNETKIENTILKTQNIFNIMFDCVWQDFISIFGDKAKKAILYGKRGLIIIFWIILFFVIASWILSFFTDRFFPDMPFEEKCNKWIYRIFDSKCREHAVNNMISQKTNPISGEVMNNNNLILSLVGEVSRIKGNVDNLYEFYYHFL